MDNKASRQSGPLRIMHLGIPPTGNTGQRTQEGGSGSLGSHAECQRQCIRAHAEIKVRAGGNPPDASPHNGLSELLHLYSPICKNPIALDASLPPLASEGGVERRGAANLSKRRDGTRPSQSHAG